MLFPGSLNRLRRNPYPLPCFPYRSFEHVSHIEVASDLFHVDHPPFVGKARIAGDDEEPANTTERGDDSLDHAVGEIFLLGVAGHVLERQPHDRRLLGQRRQRSRRLCSVPGLLYDADAAKAFAGTVRINR